MFFEKYLCVHVTLVALFFCVAFLDWYFEPSLYEILGSSDSGTTIYKSVPLEDRIEGITVDPSFMHNARYETDRVFPHKFGRVRDTLKFQTESDNANVVKADVTASDHDDNDDTDSFEFEGEREKRSIFSEFRKANPVIRSLTRDSVNEAIINGWTYIVRKFEYDPSSPVFLIQKAPKFIQWIV